MLGLEQANYSRPDGWHAEKNSNTLVFSGMYEE